MNSKDTVHFAIRIYAARNNAHVACGIGAHANTYWYTKDETSVTCQRCKKYLARIKSEKP